MKEAKKDDQGIPTEPDTQGTRVYDVMLEALSAQEHAQWSHWTRHWLRVMGLVGPLNERAMCPRCLDIEHAPECPIVRWERQANTPYAALNADEKDLDRVWARHSLQTFTRVLELSFRYQVATPPTDDTPGAAEGAGDALP